MHIAPYGALFPILSSSVGTASHSDVAAPYVTSAVCVDATTEGSTIENLDISPSYWRSGPLSPNIYVCPSNQVGQSGCIGGTGDPCKANLTGVFCSSCSVLDGNYYDESESECKTCDGHAVAPVLLSLMIAAIVIMLALGYASFKKSLHPNAASIIRRMQLPNKAKILLGFYQVVTKIPSIYKVRMPSTVRQLLENFSFVIILVSTSTRCRCNA